jgi:hypothetical protein
MITPVLICSQMPKVKHFFIGLFILGSVFNLNAQKKIISGFVKDIQNDESIPFAYVHFKGTQFGKVSDSSGRFSFSFDKWPSDTLEISSIGYQTFRFNISSEKDSVLIDAFLNHGTFNDGDEMLTVEIDVHNALYTWRTFVPNAKRILNKSNLTDSLPQLLKSLNLRHSQNDIILNFSTTIFQQSTKVYYRYKLENSEKNWQYAEGTNINIFYFNLAPGTYTFTAYITNEQGNWSSKKIELEIHILPAWWQTQLFKIISLVVGLLLIYGLYRSRIAFIRKKEKQKSVHEKELLELEAKALRAQMNPHFIFNCLNSIKSLIQQHDEERSVSYLITFSKLIRTLFNNADKKEISLCDEIETCKLYLQLEAMRFDSKFSYTVNVDENIDLKSIQIPALIVQPFIENAIWHGIMPRSNGGHISLNVVKGSSMVEIIVDDNGIGREISLQNKSASNIAHQSKGVNLTQSRLELNNLLQQRQAKLENIDKKDENGEATGTMVIIKIKEELS